MSLFSESINIGYRTVMLFIANEHTLLDKVQKPYEVYPDSELEEQGGAGFHAIIKNSLTAVCITMNKDGSFNIKTVTHKGLVEFQKETAETLINYLHLIYVNMVDDEEKILSRGIDQYKYRKAAKTMHYRERFDGD